MINGDEHHTRKTNSIAVRFMWLAVDRFMFFERKGTDSEFF